MKSYCMLVVLALVGCPRYQAAQSAEPLACRDVTLAALVADCVARIKAEPNVTKKNKMRAACLEDVNVWEKCQ